MKILIVDDSKLARLGLMKFMKSFRDSFEIIEADNGLKAVNLFEMQSPELIFMDLTMPVMDGYKAIDKIISLNKDAYIIAVSADIQKIAKEKVLKSGVKSFLNKPVQEEDIHKILQTFDLNRN